MSIGQLDAYLVIKTVHIISATVLFGTGLGTAFFFWSAGNVHTAAKLFAAKTTVRADFLFTLPAAIVQPLSGLWLMQKAGFDPGQSWLAASYVLYLLAGACWAPVVVLQIRMRKMLERAADGSFDAARFERLRRTWFALGWPAFGALVAVFFLMVTKPVW